HMREMYRLKQIEKMVQQPFHRLEVPSGKDVCRKQFFFFMDKLLQADISHGDYESYMPMLAEKFADITKEEVLKRVAALEFDRFLKYYENAEDLNVRERESSRERKPLRSGDRSFDSREKGRGHEQEYNSSGNFTRLFVNLGSKDGFYKASFLQFILDMSDLRKEVLGKIDMKEMNSWIEVDSKSAKQMIRSLDGKNYKGRRIRMNDANSR
ncbi:MAG: DbpA RNA binding domain-containing protein, partial [Parafilimonas sp.]